jgi:crossover junction endodeoxyribonuclease RuvC
MNSGPAETVGVYGHVALGIDPGLAATGYAVVGTSKKRGELCCWGAIKTSPRSSLSERLHIIYTEVLQLINNWKPGLLIMEDVYVADRFPKAALQLGEVRGVLYLSAWDSSVEIMKIRPTEVKSCLTGNGRATKTQVSRAVKKVLDVKSEIKPDHASDAAALAVIGLSRKGRFVW